MRYTKIIVSIILIICAIVVCITDILFPSVSNGILSFISSALNKADENMDFDSYVCVTEEKYGNCTLINSNGHFILINCGSDTSADPLIDYLNDLKVNTIELLIITNPVTRNTAGFEKISGKFKINNLFIGGVFSVSPGKDDSLIKLLDCAEERNIATRFLTNDQKFTYYDINFEIFCQPDPLSVDSDDSVVVKLTLGDIIMLIAGEIGKDAEKTLLEKNISSDILVINGKLNNESVSVDFIELVNPKTVIIAANSGVKSEFEQEISNQVIDYGCKLYKTKIFGNIIISSNKNDQPFFMNQQ